MLSRHPMSEKTSHDRVLAQLLQERNNLATGVPTNGVQGDLMALAQEEGHVFDHEPGMPRYSHGHEARAEFTPHAETYAEAKYPVFLETQHANQATYRPSENELNSNAESNLYRSWPLYTPAQPHDWMLHKKDKRTQTFGDVDEFEFTMQPHSNQAGRMNLSTQDVARQQDSLDMMKALRKMEFEGLKEKDRLSDA